MQQINPSLETNKQLVLFAHIGYFLQLADSQKEGR
jgi:hypothetical protein